MRLARLLLVSLLVLVAGRTAAGQEFKTENRQPASTVRSNYVRPFAATKTFDDRALLEPNSLYRATGQVWTANEDFQNQTDVCLALHTLVVARESKGSDSTRLVAQHTCTPARQFQMKSAVVNSSGQK